MSYRIAGVDVHKRMPAVVVADVAVDGECRFERRMVGTSPAELRALAEWLLEHEVEEMVMKSTAQYWRPVWAALERHWQRRTAHRSPTSVGSSGTKMHRSRCACTRIGCLRHPMRNSSTSSTTRHQTVSRRHQRRRAATITFR
jgi:hypothetical protein